MIMRPHGLGWVAGEDFTPVAIPDEPPGDGIGPDQPEQPAGEDHAVRGELPADPREENPVPAADPREVNPFAADPREGQGAQ